MENRTRILLIEDDPEVRHTVERALTGAGYEVVAACPKPEAAASDDDPPPDLVILDLGLPHGDDAAFVRRWREEGVAVVVLAAWSGTDDRVRALEAGADDYLPKPFSSRELVARVASVLRRTRPATAPTLEFGHLVVDLRGRRVLVHGEPVDLTARQFQLLALLAANPGRVFEREELLRLVWGSSSEWQSAATVTEHVHRIRRRIEEDPARPRILQTVRGAGYRFQPPAQASDVGGRGG